MRRLIAIAFAAAGLGAFALPAAAGADKPAAGQSIAPSQSGGHGGCYDEYPQTTQTEQPTA